MKDVRNWAGVHSSSPISPGLPMPTSSSSIRAISGRRRRVGGSSASTGRRPGWKRSSPLHPIAEQILSLYNTTDIHSPVFPLPSRDSIWHEIREIGVILGRHDDLSYHQARHGFGVLLISDSVSIESIAKMMGHSNISTTQGYARITEEKNFKGNGQIDGKEKPKPHTFRL